MTRIPVGRDDPVRRQGRTTALPPTMPQRWTREKLPLGGEGLDKPSAVSFRVTAVGRAGASPRPTHERLYLLLKLMTLLCKGSFWLSLWESWLGQRPRLRGLSSNSRLALSVGFADSSPRGGASGGGACLGKNGDFPGNWMWNVEIRCVFPLFQFLILYFALAYFQICRIMVRIILKNRKGGRHFGTV